MSVRRFCLAAAAFAALCSAPALRAGAQETGLRPPAIPLIVKSPYVSLWQPADTLPGTWPVFWNGNVKAMTGIARIDGQAYLFLGAPSNAPQQMTQTALRVTPTQSFFTLTGGGVTLSLDFLSSVEPNDLRRLSLPVGYVFAQARSSDGKSHQVSLYFDISGEWAHGDLKTPIVWKREAANLADKGGRHRELSVWTVTPDQPKTLGENSEYPMWGTALFATEQGPHLMAASGEDSLLRSAAAAGPIAGASDAPMPRPINDRWPVMAFQFDLGKVGGAATKPVTLVIGHVRDPAVSYLKQPIAPLWKAYWPDWQRMLAFAYEDAPSARLRADRLDARIIADATKAGGPKYAVLCALAFRQAFGATEMVGTAEHPWMFMKEISSDGNISTVDVVYPAFPVFLYTNPTLLRWQLDPLFTYAETGGWPKDFAEHDIGSSYPNADGHNDGREEDMPVEESANMLIMTAAYLRYGDHKTGDAYARQHYKILKKWADYEVANGLDPALQNQTDDFTGFIKSSANLALKAIVGVGAMGQIAARAGHGDDARHYADTARDMIAKWQTLAKSSAGDHLTLAYGQNETWSLKYNAYPDRVLGLNLIPESVLALEARYYTGHLNAFGVPLDGRHTYTKADWELWTVASTENAPLREAMIDAVYNFVNTSRFRGAFTDWYDTVSGQQIGFVARPVIGGVFALLTRGVRPTR